MERKFIPRLPRGSIIACILILLTPVAFPALAQPPAEVALELPEAPCAEKWDPETVQASPEYAEALAAFMDQPGFVDLLVGWNGDEVFVTALFDAGARDAPLPAGGSILGLPINVVEERFKPLVVPYDELDETWFQAPPLIPGTCTTAIRPGARVTTPVGGCTANFVFRDQIGRWYVGTAGHCFSALGQRLNVAGIGEVGTLIYRLNNGVGADFALVRIDADKVDRVDPAMCHWGGPVGVATLANGNVQHYGHGVGWGVLQQTRARTGFLGSGNANSFQFAGTVASGDSGSGALRAADGTGLGIITHVNAGFVLFAHSAPFALGMRLSRAIEVAEQGTGLDLTLQTAPLA